MEEKISIDMLWKIIHNEELDEYLKIVDSREHLTSSFSACIEDLSDIGFYRLCTRNEEGVLSEMLFKSKEEAYQYLVFLARKIKRVLKDYKPHKKPENDDRNDL